MNLFMVRVLTLMHSCYFPVGLVCGWMAVKEKWLWSMHVGDGGNSSSTAGDTFQELHLSVKTSVWFSSVHITSCKCSFSWKENAKHETCTDRSSRTAVCVLSELLDVCAESIKNTTFDSVTTMPSSYLQDSDLMADYESSVIWQEDHQPNVHSFNPPLQRLKIGKGSTVRVQWINQ